MWNRFVRMIKSFFGGAISAMEDPKLILEQNLRELNDQVPKMNENIATVKANAMLLDKEHRRYEAQLRDLTNKVKAAIQAGRDDIAQNYAVQLQQIKEAQARTAEQLNYAEQAYEKSLQVKQAFMRERQRKIEEAREALRAHERAQWQARIADSLEQFEVGGIDQTHDEMITRINERSARAEARMEIALDSIDSEGLKIEEDAQKLHAAELVKQFKLEMGMEESAASPARAPELETPETEARDAEPTKTAGRQRTGSGE